MALRPSRCLKGGNEMGCFLSLRAPWASPWKGHHVRATVSCLRLGSAGLPLAGYFKEKRHGEQMVLGHNDSGAAAFSAGYSASAPWRIFQDERYFLLGLKTNAPSICSFWKHSTPDHVLEHHELLLQRTACISGAMETTGNRFFHPRHMGKALEF